MYIVYIIYSEDEIAEARFGDQFLHTLVSIVRINGRHFLLFMIEI